MTQPPNPRLSSIFELQYPQSVGVYDSYQQAQAAVDHLADAKFPVENLAIVGTDLKSVERVTGRRNWGTVLVKGLQSGISTGLMVAFILWFLQPQENFLVVLPGALLIGILIGIAFAAIGYATSRGKRDFNSISQTVAAKYEVLCEHKVANQAREMLASAPGARAAQFEPRNQPAPWQNNQPPYQPPGGYPAQPVQHPGYGDSGSQPGFGPSAQPGYGESGSQPGFGPSAQPGYGESGSQPGFGPSAQPEYGPASQEPMQPQAGYPTPPSASSAPQATEGSQPSYGDRPYGSYGSTDGIGKAPEHNGGTPRSDT